jgi:CheY-like chemotaxis protein
MIAVKSRDVSKTAKKDLRAIPRNPGILIADDKALILTLLKLELEPRGFTVWLAVDGDDAIDLYRRNRTEIDLVLLDVQMPGLDGPHTLVALQRLDPDVLACFMTGNSGAYTDDNLLERGAACVFSKPFLIAELVQYLQRLVESADSKTQCA